MTRSRRTRKGVRREADAALGVESLGGLPAGDEELLQRVLVAMRLEALILPGQIARRYALARNATIGRPTYLPLTKVLRRGKPHLARRSRPTRGSPLFVAGGS